MKEVLCSIGQNPRLVGIYTENSPTENPSARHENTPTILLLNSGLLPNMGPFRLYVELARRFAKIGFNTFRFDFSGIGDSSQHADTRSLQERYMSDLKAVLDFLGRQHNDRQFILMGICTGARNAQYGMAMDSRVIGAICIDGHIYKTPGYFMRVYGEKLFSLGSWITLLKMITGKIIPSSKAVSGEVQNAQDPSAFDYSYQAKKETEMDFKKFIDRGVPLYCIFTASWCKYKNQLADSLKNIEFSENIEVTYLRNAEHTFPLIEDQQNLAAIIVDWLNRHFRPQVY